MWSLLGFCGGGSETGPCSVFDWNAQAEYLAGAHVVHDQELFKAKWWTKNDEPGTADVWELLQACDAAPTSAPVTQAYAFFFVWGIHAVTLKLEK